jgi:hypothetical protein
MVPVSLYTLDDLKDIWDRGTQHALLILAIAETAAEMRCEDLLPELAAALTNGRTADYRDLTVEEAEQILVKLV